MSGAKHKRKGDRLERHIVTTLKDHGLEARRVPLSGSVKGYPGDVGVSLAGREWVLECKSRKDFKTLYGWLEDRDALILKGDRQAPLVVLRLADVLELLRARANTRKGSKTRGFIVLEGTNGLARRRLLRPKQESTTR